MSGHCVAKLPHKCGSSDALQVFLEEGKYTGYCFSCNTYVADPYNGQPPADTPKRITKTPEEIEAEMQEVASLPTLPLPDRKLEQWALEYFGVKVGVSEEDGVTPSIHYYPLYKDGQLKNYKARIIENKQFFRVGHKADTDPFGWHLAIASGAKKLFVTEGELDAVALFQALKQKSKGTQWEDLNPAVISIVNGAAGARKELVRHLQTIRAAFKEIVLVFDMDEPGRKAVQDVLQILPTATVATLPEKDANECVIKGKSRALADAVLFRSEIPKNTRLVWATSLYDEACKPAEWGIPWPWQGMTEKTRGIRLGETIYCGAGVKMGKSELVDSIATHLMVNHNSKVFLAKPEQANKKTVLKILGKAVGRFFDDPKREFDYEAYKLGRELVGDKLCMLNLYQHLDWQILKQDIISAVHDGCKYVFIDPITNLTNGISAGEANTELQGIAQDLSAMSMDLGFTGFIFCHLKAPLAGPPHEHGGEILSSQFAGSRAMMRSCNYMMGLWGNKHPDLDKEQRNMRRLYLIEDREFGESGYVSLYWNDQNGLFNEV